VSKDSGDRLGIDFSDVEFGKIGIIQTNG